MTKRRAATGTKAGRTSEETGPSMPEVTKLVGAKQGPCPRRLRPQLAQPATTAPAGDRWLHEIKFDGYRMVCRQEGNQVQILTRTGQDWTDRLKPLAAAVTALGQASLVLDGEIVVCRADGVSSFSALQRALSDEAPERIVYYAFDLLYVDGQDLRKVALDQRKELLAAILGAASDRLAGRILPSAYLVGNGAEVFRQACTLGVEGIISKRRDRPYREIRSADWKKVKCWQQGEFVIGGFTSPATAEDLFGALLLGEVASGDGLRYVGRVGTGFDGRRRTELMRELSRLLQSASPFADNPPRQRGRSIRWLRPERTAVVKFLERSPDGRLRHPVFLHLIDGVSAAVRVPAAAVDATTTVKLSDLPAELADVQLTHPDRILYPESRLTKLDIARYYAMIAAQMLPFVANRPLSLVRCPEGIDGQSFFQKHPFVGLPQRVPRLDVAGQTYLTIRDAADLLWLVQFSTLEFHVWGCRADRLDRPERLVLDLDPDPELPWQHVVEAAHDVREFLVKLGLASFPLLTGGKGVHVVIPLERRTGWDDVGEFAKNVALRFAAAWPQQFTATVRKRARVGKIYLDYLRNKPQATAIAPYSTRARPGAPVAIPVDWHELSELRPDAFRVADADVLLRRARREVWSDYDRVRQSLTRRHQKAVGG